uniref:Uncharacterized protein n=1 Tax=Cannabis sativa TaxID=3483 RepID=A0A803QCL6_CANSA
MSKNIRPDFGSLTMMSLTASSSKMSFDSDAEVTLDFLKSLVLQSGRIDRQGEDQPYSTRSQGGAATGGNTAGHHNHSTVGNDKDRGKGADCGIHELIIVQRLGSNFEENIGVNVDINMANQVVGTRMKSKFIFLCETICGKATLERARLSLGYEGLFVVEARGHSGGLPCYGKIVKREQRLKGKGDSVSILAYRTAEKELFEVLTKSEVFWKQRSKKLLLKQGDKNSKYFHASASAHKHCSTIHKLQDEHGVWLDWDSGLADLMVSFYLDLFTTSRVHRNDIIDDVTPSISHKMNYDLLAPVSTEEVRVTLFQMHPDKFLGPDGTTPGFFQKCWDIAGSDVVSLIRQFFNFASLPDELNNTNLMNWDRMFVAKDQGGMGFRHLYDFNIALLGKQAWRFHTHKDSLVSKLFKARYYSRGSFIEAELGSNPSYIWRSILKAKDVIIKSGPSACWINFFNSRDRNMILNIPISSSNSIDNCFTAAYRSVAGLYGGSIGDSSFDHWFQHQFQHWSREDKKLGAMLCWAIWQDRNNKV